MSSQSPRFEHHCYSLEEAQTVISTRKASGPRRYAGLTRSAWFGLCTGSIALALIAGFLSQGSTGAALLACWLVLLVFAVSNFLVSFVFGEQHPTYDDVQQITTNDLSALAEMGDQHPAIKMAVSGWLADGKTLLARDVLACRAYVTREKERKDLDATMDRLKTPPRL